MKQIWGPTASYEAGVNALSHPTTLPRSFLAPMLSDIHISLFYKHADLVSSVRCVRQVTWRKKKNLGQAGTRQLTFSPSHILKELCVAKQAANELSVPHKSFTSFLFLHLWDFSSVLTKSAPILVKRHRDSWYNAFFPPPQGAGQWPPTRYARS